MLNTQKGKALCRISGGYNNGKIIYIDTESKCGLDAISLDNSKFEPLMDIKERGCFYIAGPSGSGKSSYASKLLQNFVKMAPRTKVFFFSRTNYRDDPVLKDLKLIQIPITEELLDKPIDITNDIPMGSCMFFDDCNTLQNEKLKKYIQGLIADILEIGRKLKLYIIITNHLILDNDKKFARTVMNEVQYITVFPKSGSMQQINYALTTYFGLTKRQIKHAMNTDSRWVTICKHYPITIFDDHEIYIL
jgi:hypothetical protein